MTEKEAKSIMGDSFVGSRELESMAHMKLALPKIVPEIPFSPDVVQRRKDDYILILGVSSFADGRPVTIRNFQTIFGKNPQVMEPCFYNQDWYDKEAFVDVAMMEGWFFIRKSVYEESRAVQPSELTKCYSFPSAISCTYAFFTVWETIGLKLWYHDFVWCSDSDHNGDRIYVGKYHDVDGVNKNGFSIHRHLALRPCYGCID